MIQYQRKRLSKDEYVDGILNGNRIVLSKAITLIESSAPADILLGEQVLNTILPNTGRSKRIGITGVPGVGKSTFIEAFGGLLTAGGHKLAVLTVDPSSQRTGGSILGDKTRMESLSNDPNAYIRPSPTGDSLGGVANKTRETLLLCEAAGFDIILIETVGVGQSETTVKGMVDFFLLLLLAGAGDELQGIKKGIMEMADAIVINKADGDNIQASKKAKIEFENALHLFPLSPSGWSPKVKLCSSVKNTGLEEVWSMILEYFNSVEDDWLKRQRQNQNVSWMKESISHLLKAGFYASPKVLKHLSAMEKKVKSGQITPFSAARKLIDLG
ncbi:MAG: methylmalonyl Co-A mutase-associated GTPase MeaB [Bacteroidota bacterium]